MKRENKNEYNLPMIILEEISNLYKEKIVVTIDVDYNICVYITNIDKVYKKRYLSNLEGRGLTYRDACVDFINNSMDRKYNLRYNSRFYATKNIRTLIRKSKYKEGR